jgi:integrase/recombinase XerD
MFQGKSRQELTRYSQEYSVIPADTTDDSLIQMWLHGSADSTKDAYLVDIQQFQEYVGLSIRQWKLPHLQQYQDELEALGLAPTTVQRKMKAIKSLLTFSEKTGYTPFNVGAALKLRKFKNKLAGRILSEEQVMRIILLEKNPRNQMLLRLTYVTGARVSEICDLRWSDVQERGETGQITIFGKGDKTRHVLLKPETYHLLSDYRDGASDDDFLFRSRGGNGQQSGGPLDPSQVYRIVEHAAVQAEVATYIGEIRRKGITKKVRRSHVSPHWLRHAHATHAIENGANIILVKETLGHESVETTMKYTHAHPDKSSAQYLKM